MKIFGNQFLIISCSLHFEFHENLNRIFTHKKKPTKLTKGQNVISIYNLPKRRPQLFFFPKTRQFHPSLNPITSSSFFNEPNPVILSSERQRGETLGTFFLLLILKP